MDDRWRIRQIRRYHRLLDVVLVSSFLTAAAAVVVWMRHCYCLYLYLWNSWLLLRVIYFALNLLFVCNNFGVFTQNFAYRLLVISREETHKLTISRRTMMYDERKILSLYLQRAIPDMIYLDKMTANACMLAAYLSFMYSTYTSQPQSFQRNIIHEIIYQ